MYIYVCMYIYIVLERAQAEGKVTVLDGTGGIGLHTILPLPILYSVWHKRESSVRGRILRNGRALVLQ